MKTRAKMCIFYSRIYNKGALYPRCESSENLDIDTNTGNVRFANLNLCTMKNAYLSLILLFTITILSQAQPDNPDPTVTELNVHVPKVTAAGDNGVPSDAVILFDGRSPDAWRKATFGSPGQASHWKDEYGMMPAKAPEAIEWTIADGELMVEPGTGDIITRQGFGSVQLHLEWLAPVDEGKTGQGYSNSGVFLMGMYEVQILNSYENETYSNGQAGAVYKQYPPLVNASNPPGEWQTYDIIFTAPVFGEGDRVIAPARVTVLHNGVLVQNNVALHGPTFYMGMSKYFNHESKLPIRLQDHGNRVRYRNIWVREL